MSANDFTHWSAFIVPVVCWVASHAQKRETDTVQPVSPHATELSSNNKKPTDRRTFLSAVATTIMAPLVSMA